MKTPRVPARPAPVDHELDEEREDQVRAKNEDAEDEEEEEAVTPELDAVVDEPVLVADEDEDGEPVAAPEDELAGFSEEDDLEDEDDADVPFLEEDEDDDFDDAEIEGLPGEGEDER